MDSQTQTFPDQDFSVRRSSDPLKVPPGSASTYCRKPTQLVCKCHRVYARYTATPNHLRQGPWVFALSGSVAIHRPLGPEQLGTPEVDATVFCSLTLTQYHTICYREFSHREYFSISPAATVNLGAIIFRPVGTEVVDLVASLPDMEVEFDQSGWTMENRAGISPGLEGDLMENGWTRYYDHFFYLPYAKPVHHCSFADAVDTTISLWVGRRPPFVSWFSQAWLSEAWLSQANHTFNRLGISSNVEHYGIVASIGFKVTLSATTSIPPKGYLFLCPPTQFSTGLSSSKWPDCPAYWSLDASGAECLSMENAAERGFPSVQLTTDIAARTWDACTYHGLLRWMFHFPRVPEAVDGNSGSEEYAQHPNKSGCAQTSTRFTSPPTSVPQSVCCILNASHLQTNILKSQTTLKKSTLKTRGKVEMIALETTLIRRMGIEELARVSP
ncbi:hypothetical protein K438DRAFT_1780770 [Mycena galopus ATCC 62051]|nr:hypothetical protein K438DRAFT_1780770 [Mycena galopus ATCC 62051]